MKFLAVMLIGIAWSSLLMFGIFHLESATGFNLFGLTVLFIIPAGAFAVGMATAVGVYASIWLLQLMPNAMLFMFVVLLAVFSNGLFYWFSYERDLQEFGLTYLDIPFADYVAAYVESFAIEMQGTTIELHENGKWFALLDVVGFVLGASCSFLVFMGVPKCASCRAYLRHHTTGFAYYSDPEEMAFYYDMVSLGDLDEGILECIACSGSGKADPKTKPWCWTMRVFKCPKCASYYLVDRVSVWANEEYKEISTLNRMSPIISKEVAKSIFGAKVSDREKRSREYYQQNSSLMTSPSHGQD